MNDECGDGAVACGFFIFVSPPAVVGERFAFEKLGIVGGGLIDEKQRDFPF
jgi:hypothetical protein